MSNRLKVIFCLIALIIGVLIISKTVNKGKNLGPVGVEISTTTSSAQTSGTRVNAGMVYANTKYGFSFKLPESWRGYSVLEGKWEGYLVDSVSESPVPDRNGVVISIRHPMWTKENPRQDIPIMIFNHSDWNLIIKEKLSVSAAPIGPSKLGENANYVFALPARYNYAYPDGYEEVEGLIQDNNFVAL